MARTVRDTTLESRAARERLVPEKKHWRPIEQGLHVGYRRGKRGGAWLARRFADTKYQETVLGPADDATDADGVAVLNYRQALQAARSWWQAQERRALGILEIKAGLFKVEEACDDYLTSYSARGGKSEYSVGRAIEVHIKPVLGNMEVAKLTAKRIRDWHHSLAAADKRVRTKRTATAQATRVVDRSDPDALRSRRSTANRLLTVLKAVLNHAWREGHVATDEGWKSVRPFKAVDAPVIRYLSADECRRLVNACPLALRDLVRGALLTGARYGELIRLRVVDVNLDSGTLAIREAKGGRPRHTVLTDEGRALFEGLVVGRPGSAPVFLREDGHPWKAAQATRPLAEACERASIAPAVGFHVLRHTHASTLAMRGVPMGVIAAQLGHRDTRITEKHYAHLAPSYVADTIRAHFPVLGITGDTNVATIRR